MIGLGDEVKDEVTGFTGVVVAKHEFLSGCCRFSVQPKVSKDGKLPDAVSFDEPQLKIIKAKKVAEGPKVKGGPERYMPTTRPEGFK